MKYFLLIFLCSIHPAFSASENTSTAPARKQSLVSDETDKTMPPKWLKPYVAHYRVYRGGDKKGKVTRELSVKQNLWTLTSYSKVSVFLFSDKRTEITTFRWEDSSLKTLSYIYQIKNSFSKKKTEEYFDWRLKIIRGHRDKKLNWQIPLEDNVYNPLSYQLAIRQQLMEFNTDKDKKITLPQKLTLKVSAKGVVKERVFLIENEESIKTADGIFDAVKITRENGTRTTTFWMAKKLNYIPIKIYQEKEGKEQATMVLSDIKFNIK
ncbi:MAG TPA: DUF3108 domain-containing protein [Aeromonadales bacterium]|nr:DUF3108 domain-containing protein [Aeromonadales bacterium]